MHILSLYLKTTYGYYQKIKEKIQIRTREGYQDLFEEEKNQKTIYDREEYNSLPEDGKQKLLEYRKIILRCVKKSSSEI